LSGDDAEAQRLVIVHSERDAHAAAVVWRGLASTIETFCADLQRDANGIAGSRRKNMASAACDTVWRQDGQTRPGARIVRGWCHCVGVTRVGRHGPRLRGNLSTCAALPWACEIKVPAPVSGGERRHFDNVGTARDAFRRHGWQRPQCQSWNALPARIVPAATGGGIKSPALCSERGRDAGQPSVRRRARVPRRSRAPRRPQSTRRRASR